MEQILHVMTFNQHNDYLPAGTNGKPHRPASEGHHTFSALKGGVSNFTPDRPARDGETASRTGGWGTGLPTTMRQGAGHVLLSTRPGVQPHSSSEQDYASAGGHRMGESLTAPGTVVPRKRIG
jgi:hypothetical protein